MLGARADRVHARGSGREARLDHNEELWRWGGCARLATNGRVTSSGPTGSRIEVAGRPTQESSVPIAGWLGWTDRLLMPVNLYIWGRPGEDWRLGDVAGRSTEVEGGVVLRLDHTIDARRGIAHVLPSSGWVVMLDLPGHIRWSIDAVDENPDVGSWPLHRWFGGCADERRLPSRH